MNQQINLFLPEFRKEKDWLSFPVMVLAVGVVVAVLILVSGVRFYNNYQLSQDVALKEQTLRQARERTNALVDRFGAQRQDSRLANDVAMLEATLAGKRALLDFLDGRNIGNVDGFSEHLADLARYHVKGLSLTNIRLISGGEEVVLRGVVNQAENVPLYIQNLRNGEIYNGMRFETLRIAGVEGTDLIDTRLVFDVATAGAGSGRSL